MRPLFRVLPAPAKGELQVQPRNGSNPELAERLEPSFVKLW
jgi:hypothetical protein